MEGLKEIEKRIDKLENIIFTDDYSQESSSLSLYQKLCAIENRVKEFNTKPLKEFLAKFEKVKPLLNELTFGDSIRKSKLLASQEDYFNTLVTEMKKISDLSTFLDFSPIVDLPEKRSALSSLEKEALTQIEEFERQNSRVNELLAMNEIIVHELNNKIISLSKSLE